MKTRIIKLSLIVMLILSMASASFAWFSADGAKTNVFTLGTIEVKVYENGFQDIEGATVTTYDKNVQVKSLGSKRTYVRVRLIPEWSNPSLPVSNVQLNLASNGDWVFSDGYYYYKYYLQQNELTSLLLESVSFTELGEEYSGEVFKLHVIAEGSQITHNAWEDIWGISSLPFMGGVPKP